MSDDAKTEHAAGPWWVVRDRNTVSVRNAGGLIAQGPFPSHYPGQDERFLVDRGRYEANANLISAAPDLLASLREGRHAIGEHQPPDDCYATGPLTGDPIRDLVQCPACTFIAMYEKAVAKAEGRA